MDPDYAAAYRRLYEQHWWWRAREAFVLERLRALELPRPSTILDVGCGDGLFFPALSEFGQVWGVESDPAIVGPDQERIHVGPFDLSYAPEQRFDLIVLLDVLEHLPDPEGALRHAASLLAPGGALVLTVPAFNLLWTQHDAFNHHHLRYRKQTLHPLLRRGGFRVVESRYFFGWTAWAKLGVRLKESLVRGQPSLARVPHPWVNRALFGLSRLEQRLLPRSLWGSSLYVVGRAA